MRGRGGPAAVLVSGRAVILMIGSRLLEARVDRFGIQWASAHLHPGWGARGHQTLRPRHRREMSFCTRHRYRNAGARHVHAAPKLRRRILGANRLKGPAWVADPQPPFRLCRYVPRRKVAEEQRNRSEELQRYFDKLGDFDDDGGPRDDRRSRQRPRVALSCPTRPSHAAGDAHRRVIVCIHDARRGLGDRTLNQQACNRSANGEQPDKE